MSTVPRLTPEAYRSRLATAEPEPLTTVDVSYLTRCLAEAMDTHHRLPPYLVVEVGRSGIEVSVPFDAFDAWVEALGGAANSKRENTDRATYVWAHLDEPNERVVLRAYQPKLGRV